MGNHSRRVDRLCLHRDGNGAPQPRSNALDAPMITALEAQINFDFALFAYEHARRHLDAEAIAIVMAEVAAEAAVYAAALRSVTKSTSRRERADRPQVIYLMINETPYVIQKT